MSPTQAISTNGIGPNCRRRRESLVFVVVVVIGNGAIEDENEDEDDLIAAPPRCAVSRVANVADPGPEQSQRDCASSPRLASNAYLGCAFGNQINANGVVTEVRRAGGNRWAATASRLGMMD